MKVQRILLNDFHLPMSGCLLNSLLSGFRRLMNVACYLPFHFRYFRQRYVSEQVADGTPNIRVFHFRDDSGIQNIVLRAVLENQRMSPAPASYIPYFNLTALHGHKVLAGSQSLRDHRWR